MSNVIQFNNKLSSDFGIHLESIPTLPVTIKEYEETEVPGRNGTLTKFKRYKDLEIELSCWFKCADNTDYINKKNSITDWLINYKDNNELKFSFYDTEYWKVKKVEISSFETKIKIIRSFNVKFTLEPFCYVENRNITLTKAGSIRNLGSIETKPKLTIYASGNITIFINNQSVVLKNITENKVIIDSELMNCYSIDASGVMKNINNKLYSKFPTMQVGINNISWIGNVTKIEIEGRWCN